MLSTTALLGTRTRFIRFTIDEPENVSLFEVGSNVRDFAELMDLSILAVTADSEQCAANPSWSAVHVNRVRYGSPFVVDAEVVEQAAQALQHLAIYAGVGSVGGLLWGFSRLVKNGADSYKRFEEARRIRAQRQAILGDERRKQTDWEI
jgi:hypothetical protein